MQSIKKISNSVWTTTAILFAAFSFHGTAEAARPLRTLKGTVMKVVDGDTIKFQPQGATTGEKDLNIRMMVIDTPETKLPGKGGPHSQGYWGDEAYAELKAIVEPGDKVEVDDYGIDGYGRTLGIVYKGGTNVNYEMAVSGWGILYVFCDGETDCDTDPAFRHACREAMDKGLGAFDPARPLPQLPFLFRSEKQGRPLSKFVGNNRTKKFVNPEEYEQVPLCDRVFFASKAVARAEGYTQAN